MIKSCLSRPRQALINGIFNILIHLVVVLFTTPMLVALDAESHRRVLIVPLICWIWCIVTIVLSVVMIFGVVKKRYKLFVPYLCLGVAGMTLNGFTWFVIFIIVRDVISITRKQMMSLVLTAIVITVFQLLLWLPVYFLYKTWRGEATIRTGKVIQLNDIIQPLVVNKI